MESTTPYTKRVQQLVDTTRTTDPDFIQALEYFSETFDFQTMTTVSVSADTGSGVNRRIRAAVDSASLSTHLEMLNALKETDKQLEQGASTVQSLRETCSAMSFRMAAIKSCTQSLLETVHRLDKEDAELRSKERVLNSFMGELLTNHEEQTLSEANMSQPFFEALSRLQQVHVMCQHAITHAPSPHNRLAVEMSAKLSGLQEHALEALYRFVQSECASILDEVPESASYLKHALSFIAHRPILFAQCVDGIGQLRAKSIAQRFHIALTVGGPGGIPRPIELSAHDPVRYCSDMLAWIHQAIASETSLITALLDGCAEAASTAVITKAFTLVCTPLEDRVKQIRLTNVVLAFKLSNLLHFYEQTIAHVTQSDAPIAQVIFRSAQRAYGSFVSLVQAEVDRNNAMVVSIGADLGTPTVVFETMSKLKDMMHTAETSMVNPGEQTGTPVSEIVSMLVSSSYGACERAVHQHGDNGEQCVVLLNTIHTILHALSVHKDKWCGDAVAEFNAKHDAVRAQLVTLQVRNILQRCGLLPLIDAISSNDITNLSSREGCERSSVVKGVQGFSECVLIEGPALTLPQCARLAHAGVLMRVRRDTVQALTATYEVVHKTVLSHEAAYTNPETMFSYSPASVRELLACE
eukprot:c11480_g1_i1.p1 GENE.c11480_g1_i1~~c11480_g1_i1.p1  ORF type:complete len:657 (+),score=167.69 c11480_g1_i1:60-1973(+)